MTKPQTNFYQHISSNRKAAYDYHIIDNYEAGIVLKGFEIKSIRGHKCSLSGSYAIIENGEAFLVGMHIDRYSEQCEPTRTRKLLLTKKEIRELAEASNKDGYTLIPLDVIISKGYAKILIGVAIGKKKWDKRETLKRQEAERDMKK